MNKRITSLLLCFVMVFTMLAAAVPALAMSTEAPITVTIDPDKTTASPGDTITYTVNVGPVKRLQSVNFTLVIPEGLTYVSGKEVDGLKALLGADKAEYTDSTKTMVVSGGGSYNSDGTTALMQFSCTVNAGTEGTTLKITFEGDEDFSDDEYETYYTTYDFDSSKVTVTTPHTHVYDQTNTDAAHLKTPATCTEAAVYYKSCTCGENGTETFTSGSALGHDYTQKFEDAAHLKTAASNCTEYNVYWYACSRCDANAKDDAAATDKYYTSTTAGNHSFTEQIEDTAHYVAGTGTDCQSVKKYYYDCAYCNLIGTATWDSTTYGPHDYATTWSNDADGHWHECSLCHGKKDNAAHTPGAAATETTPQKCTECEYIITPALGHTHNMTPVAAKAATCTEDGNTAYYVCSGCSKWFADAAGNEEITDHSSVVIGKLGHDWVDATCTAPKTCSRCDATEGEPNGHTEGTDWKNDANYHWHICSVDGCGAVIESSKAAHTPDHTGHATEEYAIKCSVCDYVIEAQLGPKTPVVNIAATVTAPALGQTPDYAPVIVADPADSVDLEEVYWYKIAIANFTGTNEDDWDEMASDEAFTTGYYYSPEFFFSAEDGYKITETTTGTVNGMPHDDTYGGVYDGDSYAYLSGVFEPLAPKYTIDLPVSLIVKLTGDEKPAKETFKFEIYDLGCEDAKFEIVNDTVVVENLEFNEEGLAFTGGTLKIKAVGEEQLSNLTEGFSVRMVKGSTKGWTYASEQWRIEPFFQNDALDVRIGVKEIVDGEISEVYANGMSFAVRYEAVSEPDPIDPGPINPGPINPGPIDPGPIDPDPTEPDPTEPGTTEPDPTEPTESDPNTGAPDDVPQTGDNSNMILWIALLLASGLGVTGTVVYSKRKKYAE